MTKILALMLLAATEAAFAQPAADPSLVEAIAKIKAIDNHAHPVRYAAEGQKPDDEYDALPCDALESAPPPVRVRPDNPEWIGAWRALYGYSFGDASADHAKTLVAAKQSALRGHGASYATWVLDKMGIETMFANRVALGKDFAPPRFRWVPFVDALMLPLNGGEMERLNPDSRAFYGAEARLLKRYLADLGLNAPPATLGEYVSRVVTATLERQKRAGAVALKFEAAYLRPLNFSNVTQGDAEPVYARYIGGGEPPAGDYRKLQDFLFHSIAQEAGRLGLAIHIHSAPGCGDYFNIRGANPSLLEGVFNDPSLRKTNFVIVHGGWPYTKSVAALLGKPNVYTDFSFITQMLYPRALAEVLRDWLEWHPEKVLFGTDAFGGPEVNALNWEESGWLASTTARDALSLALTGMMRDHEISRERAVQLAHMLLRDNAIKLYGLQP